MQSLRHVPHRLGPPDRPGRRTSIAVFSLRWAAFPAVVSLLLLLAGHIGLNPGPDCNACRKPIRRGMDSLRFQATSCTNGSHKQLRCSGFHRSQLTNPWRCPPHGAPTRLTEHQPRQPSVTAVNSQFALVSDPSHMPSPTVHAFPKPLTNVEYSPHLPPKGGAG